MSKFDWDRYQSRTFTIYITSSKVHNRYNTIKYNRYGWNVCDKSSQDYNTNMGISNNQYIAKFTCFRDHSAGVSSKQWIAVSQL